MKGRLVHSRFFIIKVVKVDEKSRFAVSAPKKVAKSAVDRNKIQRRTYSAIREIFFSKKAQKEAQKNIQAVFIAKNPVLTATLPQITEDIRTAFVKIGILE
ncbi:MAG: Ribonuclease [Candidatus Parcubacteria bacterium]